MKRWGSDSWRLGVTGGEWSLHSALVIRDTAALVVPSSAENPPPLADDAVAPSDILAVDDRIIAGRAWVAWWHRLVGLRAHEVQLRDRPSRPSDLIVWLRARQDELEEVLDPPDFDRLADVPQLRIAARSGWPAYIGLHQRRASERGAKGAQPPARQTPFPGPLVSDVVTSVAAEHGVAVGGLDATVDVLRVEGIWSYLAGPGYALCSDALAADEAVARTLLHDLFASSLS
jgi:hypothetical protein